MSIRHIVLWKLAADDADTRALHAEQVEERLLSLRAYDGAGMMRERITAAESRIDLKDRSFACRRDHRLET